MTVSSNKRNGGENHNVASFFRTAIKAGYSPKDASAVYVVALHRTSAHSGETYSTMAKTFSDMTGGASLKGVDLGETASLLASDKNYQKSMEKAYEKLKPDARLLRRKIEHDSRFK